MLSAHCKYAVGHAPYTGVVTQQNVSMGQRIRALREARGLTQEQLGDVCGVSGAAVNQWETGVTKNIKLKPFLRLCDALFTDPHFLVYGAGRKPEDPDPEGEASTGKFRKNRGGSAR